MSAPSYSPASPEPSSSKHPDHSLEDSSSLFSWLFFLFLNPLYRLGSQRTLELPDLGACSSQDRAETLYAKFSIEYAVEMRRVKSKQSLWMALWRTTGLGRLVSALLLYIVSAALAIGPIMILNALVLHFQKTVTYSDTTLYFLVALILVLPLLNSIVFAHSQMIMAHTGVQFRNVLVNAIYRKALRISPAARQGSGTGQIVNMFSNDTKQMELCLFFVLNTIVAPAQIAVCLLLIYFQVQEATFVGLGYMILLFPLNAALFVLMGIIRKKKVEVTDLRVKLMNEILSGIRIIKYYAWEKPFESKVAAKRAEEMVLLTQLAYVVAFGVSLIMLAAPVIQPVLIFYTYVKLGNQLDSAEAFTTLALFNLLSFPFAFLPLGLAQFSQATVSANRILAFLSSDELPAYVDKSAVDMNGDAISMNDVHMSWISEAIAIADPENLEKIVDVAAADAPSSSDEASSGPNRSLYTLRGLTFSIPAGSLVAVVGPVGSGKSSLLNGLLGELILTQGQVKLAGSVAYCDQRPWILNATIRDNILFGLPYDDVKFEQTLDACCLRDDIRVLPGGLLTEIGERGINLSGGQKARVALARAVYRDASVYLLDDPLSAVDAHVGQYLFAECLRKQLAGKTRILVTHQVHLLDQCDIVLVLVDGELKAVGSFKDLVSRPDLDINDILGISQDEGATDDGNDAAASSDSAESAGKRREEPLTVTAGTGIIEEEEKKDGSVSLSAYTFYVQAGGWIFLILAVLFAVFSQGFNLLAAFWLSHWGEVSASEAQKNRPLSGEENIAYLNMYAVLTIVGVVLLTFRSVALVQLRLGCSLKLHEGLLTATLAAPVAFFDITPIGRILNRFSSDMLTVDEELSQTINQMTNAVLQSLGALGAIAGATNGTFLVLLAPIIYVYMKMQEFFRMSNTAIARLESVSRSPIYADFSQVLAAISTIRAYGDEKRFIETLEERINNNSTAAIMQQLGSQWLGLRLDFFGAIISFFVALVAVLTLSSGFIPSGYLALGLTYSFLLTTFLKFAVRMIAQFEAQMNSVERVKYYMDTIAAEESDSNPKIMPPPEWPEKGAIVGKNLQMRYRDGPLVLKGVDFSIGSMEKVGIAGRTGSGKSSLMVALFRIQELAGGQVLIDGVDSATVPLSVLRSKLGIIPQDPVMFSASLRFNLDPFSEYSDKDLWDVLRNVNMDEHVGTLSNKLLEEVAEGGDNFSAGQRQLICIARALLRKPKILVMDEATASVDNDTDAFIQRMVREKFKDSTVLTIAHRLHTIIDYDKIMVLDSGHLVEIGAPENLIEKQDGFFKSLWMKHQSSHRLTAGLSMKRISSKNSLNKDEEEKFDSTIRDV